MVTVQQQARALGDPTRHEIFRYVCDAGHPVGVAELTEHLRVNHNAVRQHLAKLVDAGLVVRSTARSGGRGRPRLTYVPHPATHSRWGVVTPYQRLSLLLTEIIRTGDPPEVVGRRAAREFPRAHDADAAVTTLAEVMTQLGFDARLQPQGAVTDCVLESCPFADAVLADRDTICGLHRGLAEGLTEVSDVVVEDLVVEDPRTAGCRIRLRLDAATSAPPGDVPPR